MTDSIVARARRRLAAVSAEVAARRDGMPGGVPRGARTVALVAVAALAAAVLAPPSSAGATEAVYVADLGSGSVSAFSVASDGRLDPAPGSPLAALAPLGIAVTPDGRRVYVANFTNAGGVSGYSVGPEGGLSAIPGSPFPARAGAWGLAIAPDGRHLYVADDGGNCISAYTIGSDGSLAAVSGSPFMAGSEPTNLAITPDGRYLYTTNQGSSNVSAFALDAEGALSAVSGSPFPAGESPRAASLTPDGRHLYVADESGDQITAFSIAADGTLAPLAGSPFPSADDQLGIAVAPDGRDLYTTSSAGEEPVSAFSLAVDGGLSALAGSPFKSGGIHPNSVAVSPDSSYVYVTNYGSFLERGHGSVSALSVGSTGKLSPIAGSPFPTTEGSVELAVSPDRGPEAAFTATGAPTGDPSSFDATASSDPDNALASYTWEFGDGQTEATSSATTAHTFSAPGTYTVALTVTDAAACSTSLVFTGQTVSCNGSSRAQLSRQVRIPAGVRLNVVSAGTGAGEVTSTPAGIACPETCSYAYEAGAQVALSAGANAGSRFLGWQGAGCSGTGACQVTVGSEATVTASFEKLPVLSVSLAGSGSGSLASSPAGIACPGTCAYAFEPGIRVVLTPTAGVGSVFLGWESSGCSGTGACQVTVGSDMALVADFGVLPATPLESLPGPPPSPPASPPSSKSAPSVERVHQSTGAWRAARRSSRREGHDGAPVGTTFSFALNEPAAVSLEFVRLLAGVQSTHGCRVRPRGELHGRGCTKSVTAGTLSHTGHVGLNRIRFSGRISRARTLDPGRYRLIVIATNAAGLRSSPTSLAFTVEPS
jgi:6-phosphogluconolactonase (cycloisomerase 2 family)